MKLLKQFIQQETVLTAAAVLAVVSAFFVPPDVQYLGYIDLRTLAILFSLMTVMAGLRRQGFFDGLGRALLSRTHSTFQLTLVLVGLCFFGSMFITNDVSLLTFVPFTFVVLSRLGADVRRSLLVPVVCMQTIAANLGSMLTPIGNPQNLYLYAKSGMGFGELCWLMTPYVLISGLCLVLLVFFQKSVLLPVVSVNVKLGSSWELLCCTLGFIICLLGLFQWVSPLAVAATIFLFLLFANRCLLAGIDYSLLATFFFFFIFIGNIGNVTSFKNFLSSVLAGHVLPAAVLASQVISNVPAALLLSGFTTQWDALIVGCNLGGLGTLIASMASLISYKIVAKEYPDQRRIYFIWFTVCNICLLALLLLASFLLA